MNKFTNWLLGMLLMISVSSCSRPSSPSRPISYNFTIKDSDGKKLSEVVSTNQLGGFHWHGHGQGLHQEGSLFHDVQQIEGTREGVRLRVTLWSKPPKDRPVDTFHYDKTHFLTFDEPFSLEAVPGLWLVGVVTTDQTEHVVGGNGG